MTLTALFHDHLNDRMRWIAQALSHTGFDTLIISSGEPFTYFADDQEAPFNTTPHFHHYCPLAGPHHVLKLQAGRKPQLIRYAPEDFWYEQLPLGAPFWLKEFELVEVPTVDAVWDAVGKPSRAAYIGNELVRAAGAELELNPASLVAYLDWGRAFKTPYEIACVQEATILGAKGHKASHQAFLAGASELEIHYAFVQAVGCLDHELAFPSIVALDEKSATLHYEKKRDFRNGRVLLLDCGARHLGYPSDITRTHLADSCDGRFRALRNGVEKLELELCDEVVAGRPWGQVHHLSHLKIGDLLHEAGILKTKAEESVAKGFTRPFFPHGLGHFLGIQVHDVAGQQASPDGAIQPPPPEHPNLRTTQTLAPGHLITVEPGLYFIPMLLRPFREGGNARFFDWNQIDELTPLGGIRIEDNVLVTQDGPLNLTRKHLPN